MVCEQVCTSLVNVIVSLAKIAHLYTQFLTTVYALLGLPRGNELIKLRKSKQTNILQATYHLD